MPASSVFDSFSFLLQATTLKYILLIPVGLILLDFLSGVISALRRGVFVRSQLSDFLSASGDGGKFITVMIATFSAYLFSGSNVTVTAAAMATVLVMCYSLITSIAQNIGEAFSLPPAIVAEIAQGAESVLGFAQEQQALQQQQGQSQQPSYIQQQAAPRTPSYIPAPPSMLPPAPPTPSYPPASFSPQSVQQQQQTPLPVMLTAPATMAPFTPLTNNSSALPLSPPPMYAPVTSAQPMPPMQSVQPQVFPSGL